MMKTDNPLPETTLSPDMQAKVQKLTEYVDRVFANGSLNIFAPLMQTDYRILMYLNKKPGAHPSVMADDLNITRPNIAANLRILEEKNFISREMDPSNRRQIYVYMTDVGKDYLLRISHQLEYLFACWLTLLGDDETKQLFHILEISSDPKNITADLRKLTLG